MVRKGNCLSQKAIVLLVNCLTFWFRNEKLLLKLKNTEGGASFLCFLYFCGKFMSSKIEKWN
jgi:hypothetical protein